MNPNLRVNVQVSRISGNKTRQGYARKRTLKLAGYFFPAFADGVQP